MFANIKGWFSTKPKTFENVTMIDIGCGHEKEQGYFGLDIYRGQQVDWVMDFNTEYLPFKDNSIDHAVTYHCLEHIVNLQHILHEVWRVLKPNAQFFVCLPYFNSYLNYANIFHVRNFNEHSFRFFSNEPTTQCLPEKIWRYNFANTWGLKGSANSTIDTEFRTIKIEFDYFPEYKHLSDDAKQEERLQKPHVVHNICFYLQAIKPSGAPIEIDPSDVIVPDKRKWMIENDW